MGVNSNQFPSTSNLVHTIYEVCSYSYSKIDIHNIYLTIEHITRYNAEAQMN
jgi:hypothetical protein